MAIVEMCRLESADWHRAIRAIDGAGIGQQLSADLEINVVTFHEPSHYRDLSRAELIRRARLEE